jgi:PKD repeat protein
VEAWFKAPAGTRGKLIGFGDRASGNSANHDRSLYLNTAGNLVFSVRPTTTALAVTSPATYNDGASHHVVASFTAGEAKLYVDGQQVAARTDVPNALALNGWWRVGGDVVSGLPTPPTSGNFNGVLDEVAVYPTALSAAAVQKHYDIGFGNAVNQPPTASFTAVPTGLDVALNAAASTDPDGTVDGYAWQFGDNQTGTGASTQHSYAAAGTYTITLTVTDNGGATASTTREVTVADTPAGPVTVAADAFGRTVASGWGTADTGGAWTHSGSGTTPSVADGSGRLALAVGRTGQLRLGTVSEQDVDLTSTMWVETMPTGGGVYLADSVRVNGSNEYRGRVRILADGSTQISITRVDAGTETTVSSSVAVAGLTYTAGKKLNLRTEAVGSNPTTVRTKVWEAGTTEPATWQRSVTDSTAALQAPGAVGVYGYLSGSATAAVTVRADDLTGIRPAAP